LTKTKSKIKSLTISPEKEYPQKITIHSGPNHMI